MSIPPATPGVMLHGDEAADLAWLLGEVEDWLLHTDTVVLDDLDRFLGPVAAGQTRASDLLDLVGRYASLISRRHRGAPA